MFVCTEYCCCCFILCWSRINEWLNAGEPVALSRRDWTGTRRAARMMQTGTICEFSLIVVNKTYAQKKTRLWSLAGLLLVVFCLLSRRQTGPPKRHPWNTTDIYLFFVWPRTPILCPWLVQEGFFGPLQLPRTTKTSSPRWQFYCWDLFVVLGGFHLTGLFYNFVSFGCHSRKPAVLHWDR
jgi:hypothetical protein